MQQGVHRHIIVSGDDALATTIAAELQTAGATIVKLVDDTVADTKDDLAEAGIARAAAVVCAGSDDAINLEIALLARKANPSVRVVARLANDVLREAVADDNGPGAVLDVAELAAPSVVEAALARTAHPFEAAGIEFLVTGAEVPYDATLREIYADLAPVAVIHGKKSLTPGLLETCPGRDLPVRAGDWTAMIGTADELASRGIRPPRPHPTRVRKRRLRRAVGVARGLRNDVNPMFMRAIVAVLAVLIGSTVLLRFCFQPHATMTWVDALYFSTETIATVGYGDFSFLSQPTWLRLFSIMLMFAGLTTTAVMVAFIADVLISRRFASTAGRRRARHLRNHVIVVGLGSFGSRVIADLNAAGYEVVAIELDENNRYLSTAAELEVPVVFGDATLRQTLAAARVDQARAVAVLTHDDMVNIEIGIVLREMLGPRVMPKVTRPDVPIVLRIFDRTLGGAVAERFGFDTVRSTVELAAPWFIGAAMGLQVLGTFSVGQRYFMVGGMHVAAGSELDGLRMFEMSTQTRVIAITRDDSAVQLHPRRDARLRAGDTVYLVGPYRELVATLQKGQPPLEPDVGRDRLPA
ncbi:potassium channel protein [Mycobacterium shigaense]|uniref:Potassium transporter TrkA n=1 Tax=Mycobacterium shigaense TaxID=722731 RepID=A0A1Z4ELI4_9MYCO|nr:potassium channel protein [Mycobacterium shigaense]MEA1121068.1 NAD-binding protein [Mycobacterium shigaense]PRI14576.1 potassium transporter TrkA [Mycobacterium shigaense]BAX93825.1 potassium transporter TrkA [Mycobacterium shigaense]